jgi:hypothetical protein
VAALNTGISSFKRRDVANFFRVCSRSRRRSGVRWKGRNPLWLGAAESSCVVVDCVRFDVNDVKTVVHQILMRAKSGRGSGAEFRLVVDRVGFFLGKNWYAQTRVNRHTETIITKVRTFGIGDTKGGDVTHVRQGPFRLRCSWPHEEMQWPEGLLFVLFP